VRSTRAGGKLVLGAAEVLVGVAGGRIETERGERAADGDRTADLLPEERKLLAAQAEKFGRAVEFSAEETGDRVRCSWPGCLSSTG